MEGKRTLVHFYNPCKPLILPQPEEIMNKIRPSVVWVNILMLLTLSQGKDLNSYAVDEFIDNCNLIIMNDS